MYLLLNGYKLFVFINRTFRKNSFKIKTFVLFLFLDKVVNCSDFFVSLPSWDVRGEPSQACILHC